MNKISLPRIIVAGLLFIIGGILVFNVPIRNAYMKYQTSKFQIEHVSRKKIEVNSKKPVSYDYSTIKAISTPDAEATRRTIIRGEYQSKVVFNHADKAMSEAFNKGYNLIN